MFIHKIEIVPFACLFNQMLDTFSEECDYRNGMFEFVDRQRAEVINGLLDYLVYESRDDCSAISTEKHEK